MSAETESIDRGPLIIMVKVEDSTLEGLIGVDTIMVDSIIIAITEEDKYIRIIFSRITNNISRNLVELHHKDKSISMRKLFDKHNYCLSK